MEANAEVPLVAAGSGGIGLVLGWWSVMRFPLRTSSTRASLGASIASALALTACAASVGVVPALVAALATACGSLAHRHWLAATCSSSLRAEEDSKW